MNQHVSIMNKYMIEDKLMLFQQKLKYQHGPTLLSDPWYKPLDLNLEQ